jgi:hypothetical protein
LSVLTLFAQVHEKAGIVEIDVAEGVTERALHDRLIAAGVALVAEALVFVDECEEPLDRRAETPVKNLRHGSCVHVSRCRRIATTVHFTEKTIERSFPPGARVHAVKAWAAHEFHLDHKDAAEHVLQLCNSTTRPPSDTPLHALTTCQTCAVCFDLVPEKRVEG